MIDNPDSASNDPVPDQPLPPLPDHWVSLGLAFFRRARTDWKRPAAADSTGASLTYGSLLTRSFALARFLGRTLGPEEYVGVMLPPSAGGAVTNLALTLLGKIPVNLNYTANQVVIDSSCDQCGIRRVVTSRKFVDKVKLTPKGELIHLEDAPAKITLLDKIAAALTARAAPESLVRLKYPGLGARLDSVATVIFTSGSTGDPKGVMLSHRNVLSNVWQVDRQIKLLPDEVVLGILPFFHSFGYTVTLWTIYCLGKKAVYHFNPLDARIVGDLCESHKVTMLAGTPTFTRTYLQRCKPETFKSLVHILLGAEKLKPELARDIQEKLGVEPMEGYGCTELSPVVAVNVLESKTTIDGRVVHGNRIGTVGMPVPGTAIKTTDPDTGNDLPRGAEGVINVKGPQVMMGYLNRPEATAKVVRDGWYSTGDLGYLDSDGFLKITDRLSRFSKIGGEMVPHLGVESAVLKATGVVEQNLAVTAIPDAKRGERLAVIHTDLGMTPAEVVQRLNSSETPKLWIPSADDFVQVESIPILGTGKLDLRALRQLAQERLGKD